MQPYLLPYLGYWQLISAADVLVLLDDVNFIPRGWINRNRILVGGQEHWFTIPVKRASQNSRICDLALDVNPRSSQKLWRTIEQSYSKTPYWSSSSQLVWECLQVRSEDLATHLHYGISLLCSALQIETSIKRSSADFSEVKGKGSERIINICLEEGATHYVNLPGGRDLYSPSEFALHKLKLSFLQPDLQPYPQSSPQFNPGLSIVDCLFNLGLQGTAKEASRVILQEAIN